MHLVAALFFTWALLLTIPLHLIFTAVSEGSRGTRIPRTHIHCPWCQEPVHKEATICPHCRKELVPDSEQKARAKAERAAASRSKAVGQR